MSYPTEKDANRQTKTAPARSGGLGSGYGKLHAGSSHLRQHNNNGQQEQAGEGQAGYIMAGGDGSGHGVKLAGSRVGCQIILAVTDVAAKA